MADRLCKKCQSVKPLTDFFHRKRNKDGYATQCKICSTRTHKHKYKTDEAYRKKRIQRTTVSKRKKWYGITEEEFDKLLETQKGCCAICNTLLDRSRKGLCPFLDHSHSTGKVRGILCGECNRGLGFFKDNEMFLFSAIQYLIRSR